MLPRVFVISPVSVRVSALDTFQLNVEESPAVMFPGLAVNELITGKSPGGAAITKTTVVALDHPAALVAVKV